MTHRHVERSSETEELGTRDEMRRPEDIIKARNSRVETTIRPIRIHSDAKNPIPKTMVMINRLNIKLSRTGMLNRKMPETSLENKILLFFTL
jgi:hypothetical protein